MWYAAEFKVQWITTVLYIIYMILIFFFFLKQSKYTLQLSLCITDTFEAGVSNGSQTLRAPHSLYVTGLEKLN